jgi:streptomycin 6-kinase
MMQGVKMAVATNGDDCARRGYVEAVNDTIARIEAALAAVQRTLDALSARGNDDAAFEIAKLQFSSSIRASWPGNLLPLADALEKLPKRAGIKLSEDEMNDAVHAASELRKLIA